MLFIFVIASIYDLQIMNLFANLIKINYLKYLSIFYHQSGFTELYIAFGLALFVIAEYLYFYLQKEKRIDRDFWLWLTILSFVIIWVFLMYLKTKKSWEFNYWITTDEGEKIQYNIKKLIGVKEFRIILIIIVSYQFFLFSGILLYIKLVFVKKPFFYEKQYWIISLKVLIYFFIVYGLVASIKIIMGKDYYVGIGQVLQNRVDFYAEKYGTNIIFNPNWITFPDGYQPWWTFNGLIGDPDGLNWAIDKILIVMHFLQDIWLNWEYVSSALFI